MSAERFDAIEQKLETVTNQVREEIAGLGADLRGEIGALRSELRQEIAGLGSDLRQEIAGLESDLRQEISGLGSELRQEIAEVRSDLGRDIKDLGHQMRVLHEDTIDRIAALAPDFGPIRREFNEADTRLREDIDRRLTPLEAQARRRKR
jgi:archaellum component FlaC